MPAGPPGSWNPAPPQSSSNNGCLKACLIAGVVVVVLGVILVIVLGVLGLKLAESVGINPDGSTKACDLISQADIEDVLGPNTVVLPQSGFADVTIGQVLDNRIIGDAPDCWAVGGGDSSGVAGRLARQDGGDASGAFAAARATAQAGGYLDTANPVSGLGDEAFCTTIGDTGSAGVLVRSGSRLVYVSLIDPATMAVGGESDHACKLAQQIAAKMLK